MARGQSLLIRSGCPARPSRPRPRPIGSLLDRARIAQLRHSRSKRAPVEAAAQRRHHHTRCAVQLRLLRPHHRAVLHASGRRHSARSPILATVGACSTSSSGCLLTATPLSPPLACRQFPDQLAARLPAGTIRLETPVASATANSLTIDGGESHVEHDAVVVATEGPAASALLGLPTVASKAVGCVYFAADASADRHQARHSRWHG